MFCFALDIASGPEGHQLARLDRHLKLSRDARHRARANADVRKEKACWRHFHGVECAGAPNCRDLNRKLTGDSVSCFTDNAPECFTCPCIMGFEMRSFAAAQGGSVRRSRGHRFAFNR